MSRASLRRQSPGRHPQQQSRPPRPVWIGVRGFSAWTGLRSKPKSRAAPRVRCTRSAPRPCSASATSRPEWLFVGEGPGAEEDERGEPFVGQAGKLLDSMLAAIGLRRGANVYIANVVKCRPPGNRTPAPEEAAACEPFLDRQIELIAAQAPDRRSGRDGGDAAARHATRAIASLRGRRARLPRHPAGRHLPSGLPPAQPARQGEGLGRPVFARSAMARLRADG